MVGQGHLSIPRLAFPQPCPTLSALHLHQPPLVGDANRGCARAWRSELAPLWRALGSAEGLFDSFEGSGVLVYGCPLRLLFKPGPKLMRTRKARQQEGGEGISTSAPGTRISCHLRFGDAHFLDKRGIAEQNQKMVDSTNVGTASEGEGKLHKLLLNHETVLSPGRHGGHGAHPDQVG